MFSVQVAAWRYAMGFEDASVRDVRVNKEAWAIRTLFSHSVRRWFESERPKDLYRIPFN